MKIIETQSHFIMQSENICFRVQKDGREIELETGIGTDIGGYDSAKTDLEELIAMRYTLSKAIEFIKNRKKA